MTDAGSSLAYVASLLGDPGRANMLTALFDGRALTATELAGVAGVAPATASGHLAKLVDGGLLALARQGGTATIGWPRRRSPAPWRAS